MNKREAMEEWVAKSFSGVPHDWIGTIMEKDGDYMPLPMWGTMWIVQYHGSKLLKHSRLMVGEASEIDLDAIEDDAEREEVKTAIEDLKKESIAWGGCAILEGYVDEEMAGARCVLDVNGNPTAAYIYEVGGEYVLGINGAGWDFYDGVWDKLYELCGIKWHNE